MPPAQQVGTLKRKAENIMEIATKQPKHSSKWSMTGAILSAIAASACCIGPLVLLAIGMGGAWASGLRALEPYRPLFVVVTISFLGYAFYRAYRTPAASCSADGSCAPTRSKTLSRTFLWILSPLVVGLLAFPYVAPHLLKPSGSVESGGVGTNTVVLKVENMTCAACATNARQSLLKVEGVKDVTVTAEPPQAVVIYDPAKVSPDALTRATAAAGYPSSVKAER